MNCAFHRMMAYLALPVWTLCSCAVGARGAELLDIRTGFHQSYSRLVLQFDSKVNYEVSKELEEGKIAVNLQPVTITSDFGPTPVEADDLFLRQVHYRHSSHRLTVTLLLRTSNIRLVEYTLERPYRLVIDLHQGNFSEELKQDSSFVPPAPAAPEMPVATDSSSLTLIDTLKDSEATLHTSEILLNHPPMKSSVQIGPRGSRIRMFLGVTIILVLIDILIFLFYKIRKSRIHNSSEDSKKTQTTVARPGAEANPHFKAVLGMMVKDEHTHKTSVADFRKANGQQAADLSARLESLSRVLFSGRSATRLGLDPEDLSEGMGELEAASGIPKEFWIGRDGIEFVNNIKKLNMNMN
ncbi:MAG: hypothetical protein ACE5HO_00850 [bacterium]